ncbi:hypothetical protein ACHAPJ_004879 [Fusarium lateritium]
MPRYPKSPKKDASDYLYDSLGDKTTKKGGPKPQKYKGQKHGEYLDLDEDGDVTIVSEPAKTAQTQTDQQPRQHRQERKSIRKEVGAIHRKIFDKTNTAPEVQEFCSLVGDLYAQMLECALGVRDTGEADNMDWQPEPTTPVYLVRMTEELSSYPDGAVVIPWEAVGGDCV